MDYGKLIELLNEYVEKYNKSDLYYTFELEKDSGWLFCYDDVTDHKGWAMQDEAMVVCSKKFGFIKWLVENEKIDLGLYREYMPNLGEDFSVESNIIMNLSIAIDPIGYLNYILK